MIDTTLLFHSQHIFKTDLRMEMEYDTLKRNYLIDS